MGASDVGHAAVVEERGVDVDGCSALSHSWHGVGGFVVLGAVKGADGVEFEGVEFDHVDDLFAGRD